MTGKLDFTYDSLLWVLSISPLLFGEVSKIVLLRPSGVRVESDLAAHYSTQYRFYISCILYFVLLL